jgi:hypothetical protein
MDLLAQKTHYAKLNATNTLDTILANQLLCMLYKRL